MHEWRPLSVDRVVWSFSFIPDFNFWVSWSLDPQVSGFMGLWSLLSGRYKGKDWEGKRNANPPGGGAIPLPFPLPALHSSRPLSRWLGSRGLKGRFPFNPKFRKFRLAHQMERTISVWSDRNIRDQLWKWSTLTGLVISVGRFRSVGPKYSFPFDKILVPSTALLYPAY